MTKQQKAEIESLHKEGLSYRRIAEKIGVSVSCIKSYFYRKQKRDRSNITFPICIFPPIILANQADSTYSFL